MNPTARLAADADGIAEAAALLLAGEVVAIPTETVYGLAARADDPKAVARIFEAKGRPVDRPVIVHLPTASSMGEWADPVPATAELLANRFWPGPLTMILPRSATVDDTITGGRDTVGLRVPRHDVALDILRAVGVGLAAPSANRYGAVSPTTADHVMADLDGRIAAVVDAGPSEVGLESTIVEVLPTPEGIDRITLLRPGGVPLEAIEATVGRAAADGTDGVGTDARAPGMVASHYAPVAPLRIVTDVEARSAPSRVAVIRPEPTADDAEFAARLYADIRRADADEPEAIWVVPPDTGRLRAAIMDRLRRAAS